MHFISAWGYYMPCCWIGDYRFYYKSEFYKNKDLYDISKYSDKELYDILDMNNPTDRELEAKIIHLINKYDNMQNESGDKLSLFFQNIYNHFFNESVDENENETIDEGFENPTPNPTQISPSEINKFDMVDDTNALTKLNSGAKMVKQLTQEITDTNKINTRQLGKEITSVQQFDYSKDNRQLNPILKQTIKRIISIDSQYRNIKTDPNPTRF